MCPRPIPPEEASFWVNCSSYMLSKNSMPLELPNKFDFWTELRISFMSICMKIDSKFWATVLSSASVWAGNPDSGFKAEGERLLLRWLRPEGPNITCPAASEAMEGFKEKAAPNKLTGRGLEDPRSSIGVVERGWTERFNSIHPLSSNDGQFGVQGPGRFHRLQDGNQVPRRCADRVDGSHNIHHGGTLGQDDKVPQLFRILGRNRRGMGQFILAKNGVSGDLSRFLDHQSQVAVGDGHRVDADILP